LAWLTRIVAFAATAGFGGTAVVKHFEADKKAKKIEELEKKV
jgi:hypothetical protein